VDLSKPFDTALVLTSIDPAIDIERFEEKLSPTLTRIQSFVALRDASVLPIREGMQPVLFSLRPVSARELNSLVSDLNSDETPPSELWALVQRCLIAVKDDPEFSLKPEDFVVVDALRGTQQLSPAAMDRVARQYGLNAVREIGRALIVRAAPSSRALAPFLSPLG
jgi:hypothetical protein